MSLAAKFVIVVKVVVKAAVLYSTLLVFTLDE